MAVGVVEQFALHHVEPTNHSSRNRLALEDLENHLAELVDNDKLGLGFYRDLETHRKEPVAVNKDFQTRPGGSQYSIGFAPTPLPGMTLETELLKQIRRSLGSQVTPLGILFMGSASNNRRLRK